MKNIADILAACLDDIAAGTATVEECLARHEDIRSELEPLLRLGLDVDALPRVSPTNAFKTTTRAVLMEHIHNEQVSHEKHSFRLGGLLRPVWVRALVIALVAVIVLSGAGAGTVFAAGDSLPGDTLYTVKTGWEDVRDWLARDSAGSAALQMEFAGRRLEEMARLLEKDTDRLAQAVSGYENNLQKAVDDAAEAGSVTSLESVAAGITGHMYRLDSLEDVAADTQGLEQVREAAMERQMSALRSMAGYDIETAGNLTVSVMEQRMQRAAGANAHGQMHRTEQALQQYLEYAGLFEEIRAGAGEQGAVLDEVSTSASLALQNEFAGIAGDVSTQIAGEIENTFKSMQQHRYGQQGQPGSGSGQQNGQGMGSGSHDHQSGMPEQTETNGQVAGGDETYQADPEQQASPAGENPGPDTSPGPQTTVPSPQQPAGTEQGQGPGPENPGPGPGTPGDDEPSGGPQGNHS